MNVLNILSLPLFAAAMLAIPAAAQDVTPAIDPATVGQSNVIRGTMQGHADRDAARQRGQRAQPALSASCQQAWARRDQMSRAERQRLYDRCPR